MDRADAQEGLRLEGPEHLRAARPRRSRTSPSSKPQTKTRCSRSTPTTRPSRSSKPRSRRRAPTSWPSRRPGSWKRRRKPSSTPDRQLPASSPPATAWSSTPTTPNRFGGIDPAADRGRGDRPRAAEDLQPSRHQQDAGEHQGPRVDDRPDHPGLRARITRRVVRRRDPTGTVTDIAPLPDPIELLQLRRQGLHHARRRSRRALPGLRPGMSAQVEILVTELNNVLSVPVQAVLQYKGKDHIAIKTRRRRIELQATSSSAPPTTSSSRSSEGIKPARSSR